MDLHDLKKRKPSKKLIIEERDLKKEFPELKWEFKIPLKLLRVEYGKDYIEFHNKVIVPVFKEDILLPYRYSEMKHNKEIRTYPSFSNYVDWKFRDVYAKVDLFQFKLTTGVKVLKPSDEKYYQIITIEETAYNFRFNREKNAWEYMSNEKQFENLKQEIEEVSRGPEVRELTKSYFALRQNYKDIIDEAYLESFEKGYINVDNLFEIISEFHYVMNLMGDIYDFQLEQIENQIYFFREKHRHMFKNLNTKLNIETEDIRKARLIQHRATLKSDFKELLTSEVYYIKEGKIGTSIGAYFSSKQKANDNRTPETKRELENFLLFTASTKGISAINLKKEKYKIAFNKYKNDLEKNIK